ncbi:hypothetical protein AAHW68_07230 [Klebsiella pneumoniae]|uniref:hypothetical protein n=1 Tax=Klebsiella TaxID=570 RepID=UPI00206F8D1D|nr:MULTISPECIES: hypothetical protein [Klebsiella]DAZ20601.1 MAG TPA: hypothetical protein [Caudoviricetes sp.]HAV7868262.1 hypothetical protein [Escherichia coli]MDP0983274.1 hypothetical protein [Klebsiella variicola]MDP1158969.1 hypothetical protein [Klebsiella variicola]MDP1362634.1 hypothetical protein [Klebsiella variicola]
MSFTVMNPFTDRPLKECPDGTSLDGVTFETEKEALEFLKAHGANPVLVKEVKSKNL